MWTLTQWNFGPKMDPAKPAQLTDEVLKPCQDLTDKHCAKWAEYTKFWESFPTNAQPLPEVWPIRDAGLLSSTVSYPADKSHSPRSSLSIPGGLKNLTNGIGYARDVIALQQCSFCHGAETNTDFVHVAARQSESTRSGLSCFLAGKGGENPKLTYRQFREHDASVYCEAKIKFIAPPTADFHGLDVKPCKPGSNERCETRLFHELARRTSHLAAALLPEPAPVSESELEKFRVFRRDLIVSYATRLTH